MENILHSFWKNKYVALKVFGRSFISCIECIQVTIISIFSASMFESESENDSKLVDLVNEILPIVIDLLEDENMIVRETSASVLFK